MKRALIAAMLAVVLPLQLGRAVTAFASPQLTLSPTQVAPGGSTQAQVYGFAYPGSVTVSLQTTVQGVPKNETYTVPVNSSGSFTSKLTITIDVGTDPKTYTVTAQEGSLVAYAQLTVTPAHYTVQPTTASPGTNIYVTGAGFTPGAAITVSMPINLLPNGSQQLGGNTFADNSGAFSFTIQIPQNAAPGQYTLNVTASGVSLPSTAVTISPAKTSITVVPSLIPAGPNTTVTVTGQGFQAYEPLTIQYTANLSGGGTQVMKVTPQPYADGAGNFSYNTLPVPPNVLPGTYTVTATGLYSKNSASATLTVTLPAYLTASPTSVTPGGSVTITGQHYVANTAVKLTATVTQQNGASVQLTVNATTDTSGNVSAPFPFPAGTVPGSVTITGTQTIGGVNVTAVTSVNVNALTPHISLTPSTVNSGNNTIVAGGGFAFGPSAPVTVSVQVVAGGITQTVSQTIDADTTGSFSTTLSIPSTAASGVVTVTATQPISRASASATLTIVAPTATPTQTPTPTATAIPTPTSTSPPPPPGGHVLQFKYVHVTHHTIKLGKKQHLGVQATIREKVSIHVHVVFPSGMHLDYRSRTDIRGHWFKNFKIPKKAWSKSSRTVFIQVELTLGTDTVRSVITFDIKK